MWEKDLQLFYTIIGPQKGRGVWTDMVYEPVSDACPRGHFSPPNNAQAALVLIDERFEHLEVSVRNRQTRMREHPFGARELTRRVGTA